MSDLLNGELLRLRSRWFVRLLIASSILVASFLVISQASEIAPLSDDELWVAKDSFVKHVMRTLGEQQKIALRDTYACYDCKFEIYPLAGYLREPVSFDQVISGAVSAGELLVLMGVIVLVAAFIGSEFSSGNLATQLTFTANRGQVFLAKSVVAGMGAVALVFSWIMSLFLVAASMFLMLRGYEELVMTTQAYQSLFRLLVALLAAALITSGFTFLFRSGVAAVIFLIAVVLVTELIVRTVPGIPWSAQLLPASNLAALLRGSHQRWPAGHSEAVFVTYPQACVYSLAGLVIVSALAYWSFCRRDMLK